MFLTQDTGMIIGPISKIIGYLMNIIFVGLSSIGINNVGLTIILLAIVVRLFMTPLTYQQQKFTKVNAVMQPEISKIQKKYRNKKDQASQMAMQEETQAVHARYGVNQTSSCLQLIIQMPIILALYRVIVNIPAYIMPIKSLYENIITSIQGVPGYIETLNSVASADGINATVASESTVNAIIDFLYKFRIGTWDALVSAFSADPTVAEVVTNNAATIKSYNSFIFGINISESPWSAGLLSPYILIPLGAALFQFLSTKVSAANNGAVDDSNPAAGMTKSMTYTMPIFSAVLCLQFPAGTGLYWAIGSLIQMIQTIIVNKYIDRIGIDSVIEKNRKKAEKKAAKGKKSLMQKMTEGAGKSGTVDNSQPNKNRTIGDIASMNTKSTSSKGLELDPNAQDDLEEGSIASKANIMLKYKDK